MHPHGVFYNKDSEGAPYEDGTSGADKADDGVPAGGTHKYTWQVPERAGPASGDVNSVLWMYHSHVDEHRDPNTGLVGPMIITARGQAKPDGTPQGVDREFVVMFVQDHEEDSWHAEENLPANMATRTGFARFDDAIQRNWHVPLFCHVFSKRLRARHHASARAHHA